MKYIVKNKDSLSKIAQANGLTLSQLLSLNKDIKNPNLIRVGQQINLPDKQIPTAPNYTGTYGGRFWTAPEQPEPFVSQAGNENVRVGVQNGNQKLARRDKIASRVKTPLNTLQIQEELWNQGAFNGITDRRGRPITHEQAVDGQWGAITEAAMRNAKLNNSRSNNRSFNFDKLFSLFDKKPYIPSNAHNMQAVMEHKVKTGVSEPYFYISPKEGKLYRIQGNKILFETPIATGVNFNYDGYTELPYKDDGEHLIYDRSLTTSSTPAGIFTLAEPYNGYNNESTFHLIEAKKGNREARRTQIAIHAPSTSDRQRRMMNGEKGLTYGCIQLPSGKIKCYENSGNINKGDSVYIEPTVEGNYLYEDKDTHIKTHFKETPKHVTGKTWGTSFDINNIRYNTGY